jgi:hypothetical protein
MMGLARAQGDRYQTTVFDANSKEKDGRNGDFCGLLFPLSILPLERKDETARGALT